ISRSDRVCGAILGVCVADALGGPVQFHKRGKFTEVTGLRPIKHFKKPTGSWSDDSSMTLSLAISLIDKGGVFDTSDIAYRFYQWLFKGELVSSGNEAWDVGLQTDEAMNVWKDVIDKNLASKQHPLSNAEFSATQKQIYDSKVLNEVGYTQGNGSLMRAVPIGLIFRKDMADRYARATSDITHPSSVCGDACVIYTRLVALCFEHGHGIHIADELPFKNKAHLAHRISEMDISDNDLRQRLHSRCPPGSVDPLKEWAQWQESAITSSGWVVDTLDSALWAFFTTDTWKEGAMKVVNLGGDSDTAGAVYGGLAGAYYGAAAIPEEWRKGIQKAEEVEGIAE
ncbi:ADP-ribosylglycohydrolase family protein, partial [Rhizodiscina lignyota]